MTAVIALLFIGIFDYEMGEPYDMRVMERVHDSNVSPISQSKIFVITPYLLKPHLHYDKLVQSTKLIRLRHRYHIL